jgi:hypothetical protein
MGTPSLVPFDILKRFAPPCHSSLLRMQIARSNRRAMRRATVAQRGHPDGPRQFRERDETATLRGMTGTSEDNTESRFAILLAAVRHERTLQAGRYDAGNVAATAMLGFDGVLLALVPKLGAVIGWRTAGQWLLGLSIACLILCVFDVPSPCKWGKEEWPNLKSIKPEGLDEYLNLDYTSEELLEQLYLNESGYVSVNHESLLRPKRLKLMVAMGLFVAAFACIGIGAALLKIK